MVCVVSAQPWKNKLNSNVQRTINSSIKRERSFVSPPIIKVDTHTFRLDTIKAQIDLKKYGILTPAEIQHGALPESIILNIFPETSSVQTSHSSQGKENALIYQFKIQWIYYDLIPSLLDTAKHVFDTAQIQYAKGMLRSIVTSNDLLGNVHVGNLLGDVRENTRHKNYRERRKAIIAYSLLSDNPYDIVELAKGFLDNCYGSLAYDAENTVICICLIIGDDVFLRNLAKQRRQECKMVSDGWKYAKKKIPDLELSDDLISSEGNFDSKELENCIKDRYIIQKKIHQ